MPNLWNLNQTLEASALNNPQADPKIKRRYLVVQGMYVTLTLRRVTQGRTDLQLKFQPRFKHPGRADKLGDASHLERMMLGCRARYFRIIKISTTTDSVPFNSTRTDFEIPLQTAQIPKYTYLYLYIYIFIYISPL